MADINLLKGEKKEVTFSYTSNGTSMDLTGATFSLSIYESTLNGVEKISKTDSDFDKSNIANGKVAVILTDNDLSFTSDNLEGEITATISANHIDKYRFKMTIS